MSPDKGDSPKGKEEKESLPEEVAAAPATPVADPAAEVKQAAPAPVNGETGDKGSGDAVEPETEITTQAPPPAKRGGKKKEDVTKPEPSADTQPKKGDAPSPIKSKKKKSGAVHFTGISPADIEFSLRHMALMFKSGLSLTESLAVTVEQVTDERLQDTYADILDQVQQGKSIADAMKAFPKVFTDVIISIVRVSEQTGTLETNLMFLAEYLKKSYELARKVKGALIYPIIVLGLTGTEMMGVIFFIIPKMEAMFSSFENVPQFSLMVVNGAMLIRNNILYVAGGLVFLIIFFIRFAKTKPGKRMMDKLAIKFPIIKNLNRKNILASFSRTLGMLLETGIPISEAIRITGETTTNIYYSEAILEVYKEVKGGKNLADSMAEYEQYFPISFIRIIQAGEKTGTLEENLSYMYDSFSSEVEDMANNMVTLLEPIMLILAGGMIGLLAVTIVAPIYQFTSSIN